MRPAEGARLEAAVTLLQELSPSAQRLMLRTIFRSVPNSRRGERRFTERFFADLEPADQVFVLEWLIAVWSTTPARRHALSAHRRPSVAKLLTTPEQRRALRTLRRQRSTERRARAAAEREAQP